MANWSDLGPGESSVVGWAGGVPSPRLLEMGILEGTEIEVIRLAPLGDPLEIELWAT